MANLFQSDKGVKILVISDSKNSNDDFFNIDVVPFNKLLDNRICHVSKMDGDILSLLSTVRPDMVIVESYSVLDGCINRLFCPRKVGVNCVSLLHESKVETTDVKPKSECGKLIEINGHNCFVFENDGHNLPYGLYLFIDQFKSLKSKLNID